MENHEDSFVFLPKKEFSNDKKTALKHIRFGNNSLDKQFIRDIEFISLAIVQCGQSQQDKIKADILLKSMLLLFFGHVYYRHRSDQCFYPFGSLDSFFNDSVFKHFPIAAILLHGSRVLIEFSSSIASPFMDWLIIDKSSWRYLATHGISALTVAEVVHPQSLHSTYKFLKEEKVSSAYAAINLVSNSITGLLNNTYFSLSAAASVSEKVCEAEHYGFDLALGGVGNQHFVSKKIIQNNGEHGHLYINFYQDLTQKKQSGLLLGIEQSAPGKSDQYGGQHDIYASDKEYSASGGDFFCKKPCLALYQNEYQGLTTLPFANYYDSLWNSITEETLALIKNSFDKCQSLLSLLPKEKSLDFIKQLLSGPAGANQNDFDELFDRYFQEIPQMQLKISTQDAVKSDLKDLQRRLKNLTSEKQQLELELTHLKTDMQRQVEAITTQQSEELMKLSEQLRQLAIEKNKLEKNNQQLTNQLILQREHLSQLQNDKNSLLLINRSDEFMQTVIQQMGWFANKSQKKNILLALQKKTREEGINIEKLTYLLKNFISVSLMNRYYFKHETHSAKACLLNLNLPHYQPLAILLELGNPIQHNNLLDGVSDNEIKKKYYISAKYKNNLYRFYQEDNAEKNQLSENRLSLATQQIMYQLGTKK
ncbi:MAG: hypothetical protein E6K54_06360 [Gammaproteobacteria bacterium]|nr:MAG: hypothetical protein E6K54_06360 [Gammaproteobacteria bacterium]